jgi:hypothetical protein
MSCLTGRRRLRLLCTLALVAALPACGPSHTVHVCGRGDRAELRGGVKGGLKVLFLGQQGEVLGSGLTGADESQRLEIDVPDHTVTVAVRGLDAGGHEVATGQASLGEEQTCVCLALVSQHKAACESLSCTVSGGQCTFVDPATNKPVGARTLVFGENADDDLGEVTADTFMRSNRPTENFGRRVTFDINNSPEVGLLRFDLSALPQSSRIEGAALRLRTVDPTNELVLFHRTLERWDEGDGSGDVDCASWSCRTADGATWKNPGCGPPGSREAKALGTLAPDQADTTYELKPPELTELVGRWVADDALNHGLAITSTGDVTFVSSEGLAGHRPRLEVRYTLP